MLSQTGALGQERGYVSGHLLGVYVAVVVEVVGQFVAAEAEQVCRMAQPVGGESFNLGSLEPFDPLSQGIAFGSSLVPLQSISHLTGHRRRAVLRFSGAIPLGPG
ncbi:hypothetical protein [Mycolicibacterium elephantis]